MEVIDTSDFYSLQVNTYGSETMRKIVSLSVFIYGMRGLGVEIAKNIVISGPKKVTIYDDSIVTHADLGSNSFLKKENVGKICRSEACVEKLKDLNSTVIVNVFKGELANNFDILKEYKVVVISELILKETAEALNVFCRENKIGFIYCACLGLSGFSFTDFGEQFVTIDPDGEEVKQYNIKSITKGNPGIVTIEEKGGVKLELSHGDFVSFREISGMTELNETPPRPIRILSNSSFAIEDTTKFSDFISGGVVEQAKIPRPIFFKSLKEAFDNIYNDDFDFNSSSWNSKKPMDLRKINRNELLHLSFLSIHNFFDRHGRLPYTNSQEDQDKVIDISKTIYSLSRDKKRDWAVNLQNIEEYVIKNVSRWARVNVVSVCSFFGGIVAQEVVKITSKYTPFYQWFWCDFFHCVNKRHDSLSAGLDESFSSSSSITNKPVYEKTDSLQDQIAVLGNEMHSKLNSLSILLVGCGALANELLKNLALMGVSSSSSASLTIIDFENPSGNLEIDIENIQKLKESQINVQKARARVKEINKLVNCTEMEFKTLDELEDKTDDEFWLKQDVIFLALDSFSAITDLIRNYFNHKSLWFGKVLIDSQTFGTKAFSQVIVPHMSSDLKTKDDFISSISLHSLTNYPYLNNYCLDWAKKLFDFYFVDEVSEVNKIVFPEFDVDEVEEDDLLQDSLDKFVKNISTPLVKEKLTNIKKLIEVAVNKNFKSCIELAIYKFNDIFNNKIKQFVINDSSEGVNAIGQIGLAVPNFSIGDNRCPNPLSLNLNDRNHLSFINSYASLIASTFDIEINARSVKMLKEHVEGFINNGETTSIIPPNSLTRCSSLNSTGRSSLKNLDNENEKEIRALKDVVLSLIEKIKKKLKKFELTVEGNLSKYSDDFIKAASILRSQIFRIKETEFIKSGNCIAKPISSTTSTIAGLASIQLYPIIKNEKKTTNIRNCFINLATSFLISSPPFPKTKINDSILNKADEWTVWDKIEVKGPMTISDFLKYFLENYQFEINKFTFYHGLNSDEFNKDMLNANESLSLEEYILNRGENKNKYKNYKRNYLILEVEGERSLEGEIAYLPLIKYSF